MAKKKKAGRPKTNGERVKTAYVYVKPSDKKKIEAKYETLTLALTQGVLPEC